MRRELLELRKNNLTYEADRRRFLWAPCVVGLVRQSTGNEDYVAEAKSFVKTVVDFSRANEKSVSCVLASLLEYGGTNSSPIKHVFLNREYASKLLWQSADFLITGKTSVVFPENIIKIAEQEARKNFIQQLDLVVELEYLEHPVEEKIGKNPDSTSVDKLV